MNSKVNVIEVINGCAEDFSADGLVYLAKEIELVAEIIAELIESAVEVQADARTLVMDIPRLDAALARAKGE